MKKSTLHNSNRIIELGECNQTKLYDNVNNTRLPSNQTCKRIRFCRGEKMYKC